MERVKVACFGPPQNGLGMGAAMLVSSSWRRHQTAGLVMTTQPSEAGMATVTMSARRDIIGTDTARPPACGRTDNLGDMRTISLLPRHRSIAVAAPLLLFLAVTLPACSVERRDDRLAPTPERRGETAGHDGRRDAGGDAPPRVRLTLLATYDQPVLALAVPGGAGAVAIIEKGGTLRIARPARRPDGPLGDGRVVINLRDEVSTGSEQGLLGVAFHPDFVNNRRLFVNYTDQDGDTRVEEWRLPSGRRAMASRTREVLSVDQPYENHNGGHLEFGPDGMLYLGLGDGGAGGDPENRAQDRRTLLGKLLRLDVDNRGGEPYAVPPDNPFAGGEDGTRPEIWATGLRNPWRFSFDSSTGTLWIGDVGQGAWEEVDAVPVAEAGANFGWDVLEGFSPHDESGPQRGPRPLDPVHAYSHEGGGCSVTGGVVYRGRRIPALQGRYLFADFCDDRLRLLDAGSSRSGDVAAGRRGSERGLPSTSMPGAAQVVGFGTREDGEVLVASLDGGIFLLQAGAATGG